MGRPVTAPVLARTDRLVEHMVGVRLAARNHPDYALSVIINSPSQIGLYAVIAASFRWG